MLKRPCNNLNCKDIISIKLNIYVVFEHVLALIIVDFYK